MASFFILMRRDLSHCGDQLFCHDDLSARLWTVRAGYSLYEFLFWCALGPWQAAAAIQQRNLHTGSRLVGRVHVSAQRGCAFPPGCRQNNGGVVKPWNEMLLLHNTVVFMMAIASLVS